MSLARLARLVVAVPILSAGLLAGVAAAQGITGGCTATVNGRDPSSLTEDAPLVVRKDESVNLAGQVPPSVASAGRDVRSTTSVYVDIFGFPVQIRTVSGKGATWGGNVELPKVVRDLASGVYRVSGDATGSPGGWACSGSGYIKLDSNPLTKPAVYVGGAIAAAGGAAALKGRKPKKKNLRGRFIAQMIKEEAPLLKAEFGADAVMLIVLLLIWFIFLGPLSELLVGMAVATSASSSSGSTRLRGRPVMGFFGGLVFGVGLAIVLQQFSLMAIDRNAVLPVLLAAVVIAVRAWWGTSYPAGAPTGDTAVPAEVSPV